MRVKTLAGHLIGGILSYPKAVSDSTNLFTAEIVTDIIDGRFYDWVYPRRQVSWWTRNPIHDTETRCRIWRDWVSMEKIGYHNNIAF